MISMKTPVAVQAAVALAGTAAAPCDRFRVFGFSTLFPCSRAAADELAYRLGAPAPIVEALDTGGGLQASCQGFGASQPDITGAARAMPKSGRDPCVSNGAIHITGALTGFDGLSMAVSRSNTSERDMPPGKMDRALGAQVRVNGRRVNTPQRKRSRISPHVSEVDIVVIGLPPASGTGDAWGETARHKGCRPLDDGKSGGFDAERFNATFARLRLEGPFGDAGENDSLIVQPPVADPKAAGIFGGSVVCEDPDRLKGVTRDGLEPNLGTGADVPRPLCLHVRNAHCGAIPQLQAMLEASVWDEALARGGNLAERGLVPPPEAVRTGMQADVIGAVRMGLPTG